MKNDRNEVNNQKENIHDKKNSAGENLSSNEIDRIIDDVESEYFSFEYVPAITKTQKNSIHSLMVGVAENVSAIFSSYRNEKITFSLAEIDSCTTSEYLKTVADDSVLFAFDFDGTQCEVDVSFCFFKRLTGIGGIERKSMSAVDSKLCFDFIIKPILSELLRKFNLKSTVNLNFRTPKVIEKNDVLNIDRKCIFVNFLAKIEDFKFDISVSFPMEAFERLVRFGVFSRPRRPLQNPFKYDTHVVLDRIYLDPNLHLEIGSVIELTKSTDAEVEIIRDGKKICTGELVAVRDMFGVRLPGAK